MNKLYFFFLSSLIAISVNAQSQRPVPEEPMYGKVSPEELNMKSCDFENDAPAEVLFDKEVITANPPSLKVVRHQRVKIFNNYGTGLGNVHLVYLNNAFGNPYSDLEAETVNMENGKIQITPIDKKTIYTQKIDHWYSELVFALPNVKPGSVIEYKYISTQVPEIWYFQTNIPSRYSEFETDYVGKVNIRTVAHVKQPYEVNIGKTDDDKEIKVMANVHSLPDEEYMTSEKDNRQRIELFDGDMLLHTWDGIGRALISFEHFGSEFDQGLSGESSIVKHARGLNSNDEKIAYVFDTVKNCMKWNALTSFYAYDAITQAWNKKSGNSAEINLILYNLLKRSGVNAYPMVLSTREHGKMSPANPNPYAFNNTVVYVPVDSSKYYVLDATNKFNLYNTIPYDDLNSFGMCVNVDKRKASMIPLEDDDPEVQSVFVNAEIKPGGKIAGTAEITSDKYDKIRTVKNYKTDGEDKFMRTWLKNDNALRVSSFKMENMDVDTLPLVQKIEFSSDLAGSDENYIYFNANLIPVIEDNPFKSENRFSDIDFGYRDNFSLSAIFKLPAGYKTDVLPKSVTIVMPDQSLVFKRVVAEDNGTVVVRFMINHIKTVYFTEDYQDLRGFYKKMYELLNEQIVLKKG